MPDLRCPLVLLLFGSGIWMQYKSYGTINGFALIWFLICLVGTVYLVVDWLKRRSL